MQVKTLTQSLMKMVKSEQRQGTNPSTISEPSSENNFTQSFIEIEDIVNGLIFMKDGSIIRILELLPINYFEKRPSQKDYIADSFGRCFKQLPEKGHLKVMNTVTDLGPFIRAIREATKKETDEGFLHRIEDYIEHTKKLQKSTSIRKRFFFIYQYEGNEEKKRSDNWEDIYFSMLQTQYSIIDAFRATENLVIDTGYDSAAIAEILYAYFNPKSIETEGFEKRREKVMEASGYLQNQSQEDVTPPVADYVAPRGIRMGKWDYMIMDGVYHSFFALTDTSYPNKTMAGWTNIIMNELPDCDLDIYYKQLPRDSSLYFLDRTNVISLGLSSNVNASKQGQLVGTANNAKYIRNCMTEGDEDLYEVMMMVTLRANSYKELVFKRSAFIKTMKSKSFYFEPCYLNTQEYFKMAMPLYYVNPTIFSANKRNMTNSSLATLYCLTSYEMFDPRGYCMGINHKYNTLFSFNNFNKGFVPNPHIFLAGMSGIGKTFTELMLTSRMRMTGKRTMFILPLKGHEYKKNVESLGGEFISLRPGGKACINIMEIRPEGAVNEDDMDAEDREDIGPSLLAKKITTLITWVRMNMDDDKLTVDEVGELNVCLTKIYNNYGITEDNNSIWADAAHTQLKPMPIIEDIYNATLKNEKLSRLASIINPWVNGNCSNMNGQTNVDLSNVVLAFDVNEDYIGEEMLPPFMFLAFSTAYELATIDPTEECVLALDEVWKLLAIPACAKQIFKMIKILRAYSTSVITATQDIEDCLNNEYGRSILTLSAMKIFLRVNQEELNALEKSLPLSTSEKELLLKLPIGYGFVSFNADRILVHFEASDMEFDLYDTSHSKKKSPA